MAISFNNSTGFSADETSVLREKIRQDWKNAFAVDPSLPPLDTNAETPAGQLIDGETALASEKDNNMIFLANQFNPKNAVGVFQDALAQIYFLDRKVAQPTYVTCQVRGIYGTLIPYGAIVQDINGYTYINTAPRTINSDGTAEIYVRCSETGAIEVASGTVTQIITTVPGWDSVTNAVAGVTGRNEESQSSFESRRVQSVAKNSHGTVASLWGTITNLDNVVACVVLENRGNSSVTQKGITLTGHSICVSVYGGDDTDIARAIYNKLDGGCGLVGDGTNVVTYNPAVDGVADQPNISYSFPIYRPATTETIIKVTVSDGETDDLTNAIKQAVVDNFNGNGNYPRIGMGETLYASRFYADVIKAGVSMLESVKIKYPSTSETFEDNVDIPATQIPTISVDDVTVVYQ